MTILLSKNWGHHLELNPNPVILKFINMIKPISKLFNVIINNDTVRHDQLYSCPRTKCTVPSYGGTKCDRLDIQRKERRFTMKCSEKKRTRSKRKNIIDKSVCCDVVLLIMKSSHLLQFWAKRPTQAQWCAPFSSHSCFLLRLRRNARPFASIANDAVSVAD